MGKFVHKHEIMHTYSFEPDELKSAGSQGRFSMESPYLTFQNDRHSKKHIFTLLVK